ncbi:hypothetical protein [Streptomyces liangshanensis]
MPPHTGRAPGHQPSTNPERQHVNDTTTEDERTVRPFAAFLQEQSGG